MRDYGSFRVLVAEPGGPREEAKRHAQFEHLRVRQTELFHYRDEIVEHVERLIRKYPDWKQMAQEAHAAFIAAAKPGKYRGGRLVIPGAKPGGELTSE